MHQGESGRGRVARWKMRTGEGLFSTSKPSALTLSAWHNALVCSEGPEVIRLILDADPLRRRGVQVRPLRRPIEAINQTLRDSTRARDYCGGRNRVNDQIPRVYHGRPPCHLGFEAGRGSASNLFEYIFIFEVISKHLDIGSIHICDYRP